MTSRWTRTMLAAVTLGLVSGFAIHDLRGQEEPGIAPQPMTTDAAPGVYAGVPATAADYGCRPWEYGRPDLFYNFYVPNDCGGAPAAMYLAPRPVPALVGHTYYTYQPLMPHEMLYPHYRTYRQWYDDGRGVTRTKVAWYCNPLTVGAKSLHQAIRLAR
jgi:hypothetical protein